MADVKVKLLKPLDGHPEGATVEYPEADAKRLEQRGAVKIQGKAEKAEAAAPQNKMEAAPENKTSSFDHDGDGRPGGSTKGPTSTRSRGKKKA